VAYRGTNAGFRVAIDPGHIGGAWSRMEERFFLVDRERDWPVQEAAINLHVSRLIRDRLAAAGIDAVLVKDDFEPMSSARPDLLMTYPIALPPPDPRFAHLPDVLVESSRHDARRKQIEREFFRTEEIRGRAVVVNETIKPDLTICVHFNATGYGDEKTLYEENGLAFFVHGNYIARELADDEQKFFLLSKLLEQSHDVELHIAASIAEKFAAASGLPPAYNVPPGGVMHPLDTNSYIYARNLAANRQFRGPVIFLEPYFMNNRTVYARIQAGDYDGEREIDGKVYRSIFREYADAVAEGVVAAIAAQLPTSK
jgi:N-acetylmuramoyl-L-alanine amidase